MNSENSDRSVLMLLAMVVAMVLAVPMAQAADEYPSPQIHPADLLIGDFVVGDQVFAADGAPRLVTCSGPPMCTYDNARAPVFVEIDPGINDEDARGETDS